MTSRLQRITRIILAIMVLSASYLDYWGYSREYYRAPDTWLDVMRGTASAPQQYRIGAIQTAYWMSQHLNLGIRHGLAILDAVSALVAVFLLYELLVRSSVYRSARVAAQYFGAAAFVLVVQLYLAWLLWYQKPETLPSTMLVALLLWLWSHKRCWLDQSTSGRYITAACILLVSIAQALVRADVACTLNFGVFLVCLTRLGRKLALPRVAAILTSLVGTVVAIGIQAFLMKVAFPHATYGSTPVFQLWLNIFGDGEWLPFSLFMIPYAWTVARTVRDNCTDDAAEVACLVGSLLYASLWFMIGRITEVRIFIPFALALAPLTVKLAMELLESDVTALQE